MIFNKRKRVLMVVDSALELMEAIWVKNAYLMENETSLIISNQSSKSETFFENVSNMHLFHKTFWANAKEFPDVYLTEEEKKTDKYLTAVKRILKENENFDIFITCEIDIFSRSVYSQIKQCNKMARCFLLGEGTFVYGGLKRNIELLLTDKSLSYKELLEDYEGVFLFNKNLCNSKYKQIIELPPLYKNHTVIEQWNMAFGYIPGSIHIEKKVIFFEESFINDGGKGDDINFLSELLQYCGNERIILKRHPRGEKNRFQSMHIQLMPNYSIPWEIIVANGDCKDCICMASDSNSVTIPAIWGISKSKNVMLYKIINYEGSPVNHPAIQEWLQYMRMFIYKKDFFVIPETFGELVQIIKDQMKEWDV